MTRTNGLRLGLGFVATLAVCGMFATVAYAQPDASGIVVQGRVVTRDVRVRVECGRGVGTVQCHVEQRFELEAEGGDGRFTASGLRGIEVLLDGWRRTDATLPQGRRVAVEVRYTVGGGGGWPVLVPPLSLRHPVLHESWRFYPASDSAELPMPRGPGLRVEGEVVYEAHGVGGAIVTVGADEVRHWPHRAASWSDVRVEVRHRPEPFANGGPALLVGGQLRTDAPGGAPLLGVGYEVGLVEHLVLSLWFETTFQAIAQSLILEVVSPGLFILPSIAAGVGLVVTELGPRGVDAALRVRLTLSSFVLGLVADFDYFPAEGGWNIGIAGRIGI